MPRRTRDLLVASLALAAVIGAPRQASAYDPHFTHRWIARKAVEHLRAQYPGQYDDVLPHLERFVDGVSDEDNELLDGDLDPLTLRVMRHFYRPTDGLGLAMFEQQFPSSLEWGTFPRDDNKWGYDDAIRYWREGDPDLAFFAIGHVTHLIQDATVPAHTHLDIHGPPDGDSYEGYCSSLMRSDTDGDLPLPAPDAPIPDFETWEDLWLATASASYYRNMVPGLLSDTEAADANGALVDMFPMIEVDWLTDTWEIPQVGKLGKAFWEYETGLFYFKKAHGVGAVDRVAFDPYAPTEFHFGPNPSGASMNETMARDLIPVAILHSAAVLKKFMDETRDLEVVTPGDDEPADEPADEGGCAAGGGASGSAALSLAVAVFLFRRKGHR